MLDGKSTAALRLEMTDLKDVDTRVFDSPLRAVAESDHAR
jgi:hypothetical protein